jgi:putative ABC transport system ATP-binding protein
MFTIQQERQLAFLLVTHDEGLATRCDRIIRMKDGYVVDQDLTSDEQAR